MHIKISADNMENSETKSLALIDTCRGKVLGALTRIHCDTQGATAVEYGLLAGLVAIGLAGGLGALSDLVNLLFENVSSEAAEVTGNLGDQ